MKNLKIKIPKNISKKDALRYFDKINLLSFLQIKKESKKLIQSKPYFAELMIYID